MFHKTENFTQELINLLMELCRIPAPSGQEEKRAAFIQNWLYQELSISDMENSNSKNTCPDTSKLKSPANIRIITDTAKNVLVHIHPQLSGAMPLFMAHTDTVFPDTEPMPCSLSFPDTIPQEDLESCAHISSPGVGDDTACVAILMLYLKYYKDWLLSLNRPLLFAFNSCEEGLGNLKGCRQIMKDYGNRICHVTSFDGGVNGICNHAVGSLRYEITIHTRGGHSYNDFGNRNAIQSMCKLIQQLYQMQVPSTGRNTYNVGTISGGTSVNTIAQSCSCLFEYRSDTKANLEWMNQYFLQTIASIKEKSPDIHLDLNLVGERPCMGNVDLAAQQWLTNLALESIDRITTAAPADMATHVNTTVAPADTATRQKTTVTPVDMATRTTQAFVGAGSTDCNIPLSMGIPAICFGGLLGDGVHTREEYVTVPLLIQEAYIMEDYLQCILSEPGYIQSNFYL